MVLTATARRKFRSTIVKSPRLYLPIRRVVKGSSAGLLTKNSELLLEGYPRSANSFAEAAFRSSQSRAVDMAHHSHAAAYVIQAAYWGVPTLVLIREPFSAARSLLMHHSVLKPVQVLREYVDFYKAILPYRKSYILAEFHQVTSDFGACIEALNGKFGTNFEPFVHNDENVGRAFKCVDVLSMKRGTLKNKTHEPYSPQASIEERAQRDIQKQQVGAMLTSPSLSSLLHECSDIYEKILNIELD